MFQARPAGVLENIVIHQEFSDDKFSSATVDVSIVVTAVTIPSDVIVSVYWEGELQFSDVYAVEATAFDTATTISLGQVEIPTPTLWWPRGFGQPHLYSMQVVYQPVLASGQKNNGSPSSAGIQKMSCKIGLRTVELVQDPVVENEEEHKMEGHHVGVSATGESIAASRGSFSSRSGSQRGSLSLYDVPATSFYLKVNGIPIYAKGANFIPMDVFPNRVMKEDR